MAIYLYLKSGKQYKLVPQKRLTRSKNGNTGTAIFELNLRDIDFINSLFDPIRGIGLERDNSVRMADLCHFIWASGRPIRLIALFIFSDLYEKQDFFNYYPYYALNNCLEFFPAQTQENSLSIE